MKNKWCLALGIENIYKTAVVCSDHFKSEDYGDLTSRPLLKPNAIPYLKARLVITSILLYNFAIFIAQ